MVGASLFNSKDPWRSPPGTGGLCGFRREAPEIFWGMFSDGPRGDLLGEPPAEVVSEVVSLMMVFTVKNRCQSQLYFFFHFPFSVQLKYFENPLRIDARVSLELQKTPTLWGGFTTGGRGVCMQPPAWYS